MPPSLPARALTLAATAIRGRWSAPYAHTGRGFGVGGFGEKEREEREAS